MSEPYDVVVVGLGLAGLTAALAAAERGARVLALGKGYGTTHFRSGTIDVLGHAGAEVVGNPRAGLAQLCQERPEHPYALLREELEPALTLVRDATAESSLELLGDLDANRLLPTALGTLRPACLHQPTMGADLRGASVLAAGIEGYRDFEPALFAANLPAAAAAHGIELRARAARVEMPPLRRHHLDGPGLAQLFEQAWFRDQFLETLRPDLGDATLVALPAVLGLRHAAEVHAILERRLGVPVIELPALPPSVPGMRLQRALESALRVRGGRVQVGARARFVREGGRALLEIAAAAHPFRIPLRRLVLATGGPVSGGLVVERSGRVSETVAGVPVEQPAGEPEHWYGNDFLGAGAQPVSLAGIRVDAAMRPLGGGEVVDPDLFAAGGLLAGACRSAELSADGIACASGHAAGREAAS
ncbi:MAG TPA: anaerobic glycerol-3-phosphate dehydrogenase subunit GlpB [Candidatus Dormibacteraeota bacterium]|nr:anaerobic glycerol-3-phosphate dehydrogenase subunit GlpB [Candidatus Dormibacteraeota bacterium]